MMGLTWLAKRERGGVHVMRSLVTDARSGWSDAVATLVSGAHVAVLADEDADLVGIEGRMAGLEVRDTLVVLRTGPRASFVWLFRKPIVENTVAEQVLTTGTGAINVGACRVPTSKEDAKAMERANTPGSHRMKAGSSPIGTFTRSSSSGALDTSKGRWPSNVVLVHGPGCRNVGTKRVRGGVAVRQGGVREGTMGRLGRLAAGTPNLGYVDEDGLETIAAYECEPGCPVALLDGQGEAAGVHGAGHARHHMRDLEGEKTGLFPMNGAGAHRFGDTGGASRFFPQFADEAELRAWIVRLVGADEQRGD